MRLQRSVLDSVLETEFLSSAPPSPSSSHGNNSDSSSFISESNFDTNMVIILAALLFSLIFALGLNSVARCALRYGGRLLEGESPSATRTGLKKSHLRRIPVAVYGSGCEEIPATECPICLGEFEKGDKVRILPECNHGFHVTCIDTWLVSHSSCPNCRHELLERPKVCNSEGFGGGGREVPENGSGGVVVVVEQAS